MASKEPKKKISKKEQKRQLEADVKEWGIRQTRIEKQEIKALEKAEADAKEQAEEQAAQEDITFFRKLVSGHALYDQREKDFKSFIKKYDHQENGKRVEDILINFTNGKGEKYDWLKKNVFYVIYQFKNYDRGKDSFKLQKDSWKDGHEEIGKCIKAVKRLRTLHKQYPLQSMYVDSAVQDFMFKKKVSVDKDIKVKDFTFQFLDAIKKGLEDYDDGKTITPGAVTEKVKRLINSKKTPKSFPSGGWFLAGIKYPTKKPDGKLFRVPTDPDKTSFYLHLINIFHHYIADKPDLGWTGSKIPKFGKPCYETVASISTQVFRGSKTISSGAVREKVKGLIDSGVTLHSWPIPSK